MHYGIVRAGVALSVMFCGETSTGLFQRRGLDNIRKVF